MHCLFLPPSLIERAEIQEPKTEGQTGKNKGGGALCNMRARKLKSIGTTRQMIRWLFRYKTYKEENCQKLEDRSAPNQTGAKSVDAEWICPHFIWFVLVQVSF